MRGVKRLVSLGLVTILTAVLAGCAPEVGSEQWCLDMQEKPKGDWTVNEAGDFTRHCVFK